jgi:acyl carrier protein
MEQLDEVVSLVRRLGNMGAVTPDEDFYEAGFNSLRAVELLMELEITYDVQIPDDDFIGARTPRALCEVIARLTQRPPGERC